jgi:hypothetical protein
MESMRHKRPPFLSQFFEVFYVFVMNTTPGSVVPAFDWRRKLRLNRDRDGDRKTEGASCKLKEDGCSEVWQNVRPQSVLVASVGQRPQAPRIFV